MAWDIEVGDEFRNWYEAPAEEEMESVDRSVDLPELTGPILARPMWILCTAPHN